jgi:hypothetical protein
MSIITRTLLITLITVMAPCGLLAGIESKDSGKTKGFRMHLQIKPLEYSMGSIYNGTLALQGGGRVEFMMANDAIIPEIQYHRDYLNMAKMSESVDAIKPFNDLKVGVRLGFPGTASFNNLKCIDRSTREGNTITTYYEQEKVRGRRNLGLSAGLYLYRTFVNPFTKVSEKLGVTSFNAQCFYLGLARTKYIDGKTKKYSSGNTCTWDKYSYWYASALYAVNYKLGESVYQAGGSTDLFPNKQFVRPFNRTGLLLGYESGRMLRGFVGNFELGIVPALKGRGFFFKAGGSYAIGF